MSGPSSQFAVLSGSSPAGRDGRQDRQFQELWFTIARRQWASLVLVPADDSLPVGWVATTLAEIGTQLRDTPVNAIIAENLDYPAARSLAEIQPQIRSRAWENCVDVEAAPRVEVVRTDSLPPRNEAKLLPPLGRVIIAIQPVISEPLGVAIAHAADAVLVCIQVGSTRTRATRRTIELIGADRIIGALLVR